MRNPPRFLLIVLLLSAALSGCQAYTGTGNAGWAQWDQFKATFLTESGRVVDRHNAVSRSTSESQAYGMFFALVAGDRDSFAQMLDWTERNLAGGDLTARLPAWHWGPRADGSWGVLDSNPASDADLWMAYALIEAGRLWEMPRYAALGQLLAARLWREATVDSVTYGRVLLPAPHGFEDNGTLRLNASYWPLPVLRRLAAVLPDWQSVLLSSETLLKHAVATGYPADWFVLPEAPPTLPDDAEDSTESGAYDAIRVYLWVGLMHPADPLRSALLTQLQPILTYLQENGAPPRRFGGGELPSGIAPSGFSVALLPFLNAAQATELLATQQQRLIARPIAPDAYYANALALFALGEMEGRYCFNREGRLHIPGGAACV